MLKLVVALLGKSACLFNDQVKLLRQAALLPLLGILPALEKPYLCLWSGRSSPAAHDTKLLCYTVHSKAPTLWSSFSVCMASRQRLASN